MNRIIDDKIQFAGKWDKDIYISENAGKSFTLYKSIIAPRALAISSDMLHCFVCCNQAIPVISHDKGKSWNNTSLQNDYWKSAKMSIDGKVIMCKCSGWAETSGSYISINYGTNWSKKNSNNMMDLSDDGRYIVYFSGGLYLSNDYGTTYVKILSPSILTTYSLKISSKGKYIIISTSRSGSSTSILYISSNYGASFIQKNCPSFLENIDYISDDGLLIYAQNRSGYSVVSFDEGNSFVETSSVGSVRNLCVSNKTNKIYYASLNGLYSSSDYLKSSDLNNHFGATNMSFVTILK